MIVLLLTTLTVLAEAQVCNQDKAMKFIDSRFKGKQYPSHQFRGYSKELTLVEMPTLNKLLPKYCFFSTSFFSNYYEYPVVKTMIALSKSTSASSKIAHSPTYADTPSDFLKLFVGIRTSDTTERIKLANEIADIFATITHKGRTGRLLNLAEKDVVCFELWTDDLSWEIYNFHFDSNGKLTGVKIGKGVGRGEVNSNYIRL